MLDRTFEAVGAVSADIANVHAKAFENFLARGRKLLHRIKNRYIVLYAQIGKQFGVRLPVYARLKAAQVDGDSIGDIVIEGFLNALS